MRYELLHDCFGGVLNLPPVVGIELLQIEDAQEYVNSLGSELGGMDGKPLYLVHDGETGTSDTIIADLENALLDCSVVDDLPATKILQACFDSGVGFRIWWATDDPLAHKANISPVANLEEAFAAIKAKHGATWRGAA